MTTINDIDLLEGLRKQSPKAQQQMLERYGRDIFALVARLVPGIENAEEVYQDVFVKVFNNINRYDAEKSALKTWISRIAYNEAISFLRRKSLPVVYYEDRNGEAAKISDAEVDETFGQPNAETVQLITTISADPSAAPQKKPELVIFTLNTIIQKFGQNEGQVYSVNRNPNTGIIESSIKIVPFHCSANHMRNDNVMNAVAINFPKEEPLAYQFLHIQPGSNEMFSLKVITNNGTSQGTQRIRTARDQEMWLMCCKNPENPQLRDAYAIVWEHTDEIDGTIYMITSLRPDMYEKSMISNTFRIDGRVGSDLNDSLYVVYMADTAEELDQIDDNAFVATMPVVNKRFNFSVDIDKPKVGRIRTVMPDGSLCQLWTNLDFVPGETYRITTHNGWYEEDRDYENRVGRYSGHSLLNDLQRRGVDDQSVEVADSVPEEFRVVDPQQTWRDNLSQVHKMQLEMKVDQVALAVGGLKENYKAISDNLAGFRSRDKIVLLLDQLLRQNKELDKKYQEFIQLAKNFDVPATSMPGLYKEIVQFYTEQNKALLDLYKDSITNGKSIRKLHEYVTKQTEKYIKEMENSLR